MPPPPVAVIASALSEVDSHCQKFLYGKNRAVQSTALEGSCMVCQAEALQRGTTTSERTATAEANPSLALKGCSD
ncbi:hypothetical protein TYRP_014973, partial [Tyrophagus putrescentiae]